MGRWAQAGRYARRWVWVKAGKYVQRGARAQVGSGARTDRWDLLEGTVPVRHESVGARPAEKRGRGDLPSRVRGWVKPMMSARDESVGMRPAKKGGRCNLPRVVRGWGPPVGPETLGQ